MRKSRIFDASGNGVLLTGKKILGRRTNVSDISLKRQSLELTGGSKVSTETGKTDDNGSTTCQQGSKPVSRKQTFREFEEKFKMGKTKNRLLKSQSLEYTSESLQQQTPTTGVTSVLSSQSGSQTNIGLKDFSKRARDVFRHKAPVKTEVEEHDTKDLQVTSSKSSSLMSRLFHR